MIEFITESSAQVEVPAWVKDLTSFQRWAHSNDFPQEGRVCFLKGRVQVDMSREQTYTHVDVKSEISGVLRALVKRDRLGRMFGDGVRLSNPDAEIAVVPDALFVATASFEDRVRQIEGKEGGCVELQGSPDMVLEVVSTSSVNKDTVVLRRAYWEAGVREYWLVDARRDPLSFDILRHSARGFRATRKADGWLESGVFGRAFRLTVAAGVGGPEYTLEMSR
jgi:Uma2 family endonuclease